MMVGLIARFNVCVLQVSTHGYSQNQILVWKYPSLTQVAKLTGHSYRVLYLVSTASLCSFIQIMSRHLFVNEYFEMLFTETILLSGRRCLQMEKQ